ncbi:precorrin-8X methylmutase [Alphaproteobacteria bacterium 46_93_T64]|nr:precorrin-8X methylmutase [Alphaproteobacteria bacterium 46_93_T64]
MYDYLKEPAAIYEKSFATVQSEVDFSGITPPLQRMITRIIHACGMPEIFGDLAYSQNVADISVAALKNGAPILSDCEMVRHGIIQKFLPSGNQVICTLNDPQTPELSATLKTTRSAAAIELWKPHLDGAIAVFGNAPTALFHLLEMIDAGAPKPAAILGFPVGFVGAAESKYALKEFGHDIPFITLCGRKGGSAMAAAAVNGASVGASK